MFYQVNWAYLGVWGNTILFINIINQLTHFLLKTKLETKET